MFEWPGEPSPHAEEHELADFLELTAWRAGGTSAVALSRLLGRLGENDYRAGVPEEDEVDRAAGDAFAELDRRRHDCGGGYPFVLGGEGATVRLDEPRDEEADARHAIYKYLLLATRLNMRDNRRHAGRDGALLFEELAAETAKGYLGARSESLVFGTAAGTADFPGRIDELCARMGEGGGFRNRDDTPPRARDGKLDVVAWKPFADRRPGKLIAFGQCKTGTHYRDELTQLQPDSFCSKWLHTQPAVTPVRMFFLAEARPRGRWRSAAVDAGILFDRCRVVDFCRDPGAEVRWKVREWTRAAAEATGLPGGRV